MNRTWVAGIALMVAVVFPSVMLAHEGHPHKIMGTVSAVTATQLDLKATDGKVVAVVLNEKTVYLRGKTKVDAKELKVGQRVVVSALQAAGAKVMTAQTVELAVAAAAAAAR